MIYIITFFPNLPQVARRFTTQIFIRTNVEKFHQASSTWGIFGIANCNNPNSYWTTLSRNLRVTTGRKLCVTHCYGSNCDMNRQFLGKTFLHKHWYICQRGSRFFSFNPETACLRLEFHPITLYILYMIPISYIIQDYNSAPYNAIQ